MKDVSRPGPSGGAVLERPRYYPRQLMTPDELTLEAEYFRERMRRHNVHLHGWGVVSGALVVPVRQGKDTTPWVVRVQPGYVLGPYGDEIVIGSSCEVPLSRGGTAAVDDSDDPWCSRTYAHRPSGPLHLAVRYREVPTRPVRAQPAGCGCDETPCEYSRYRDGHEFGLLDECPDSHRDPARAGRKGAASNPRWPEVPDSPWVVLAVVTLDADGVVTGIDNCACRRIVASARDHWYRCGTSDAGEGGGTTDGPTGSATGHDGPGAGQPATSEGTTDTGASEEGGTAEVPTEPGTAGAPEESGTTRSRTRRTRAADDREKAAAEKAAAEEAETGETGAGSAAPEEEPAPRPAGRQRRRRQNPSS